MPATKNPTNTDVVGVPFTPARASSAGKRSASTRRGIAAANMLRAIPDDLPPRADVIEQIKVEVARLEAGAA